MKQEQLCQILITPTHALALDAPGWDRCIRLARASNVLARLAEMLDAHGLLPQVPQAPRQHLRAALALSARQRIAGLAEVERIREALAPHGLRCVLLKGAAYLAADLPTARGRLYGDIDLLFPRARLAEAESALMLAGWHSGDVTPYDQRYYRQWMHELPPFTHLQRYTVLDVHHNILPLTARHPPDAQRLLDEARELHNLPGIWVLSQRDMVLHSACHLFHEGEFPNGLRDLADLDSLLRNFSQTPDFWMQLLARAEQLHLMRPLHYALRYANAMLATPIPEEVRARVEASEVRPLRQGLMDALYLRALRPLHPLSDDRWSGFARWLLYVRAHWLRMPPHLLAMHLARKAWYRFTGFSDRPPGEDSQQAPG